VQTSSIRPRCRSCIASTAACGGRGTSSLGRRTLVSQNPGIAEPWYRNWPILSRPATRRNRTLPPPINPTGPGQLDDYTHVRIYAARTDQLFPAIYKEGYGAWVSPYVGTGDWGSFYGLGERYTYMPFNDKGPVVAFYNGTDSIYGEDFAYQLDVYYGSLSDRFQLDQYSERADAILEKTVNPYGGSTGAVDALLAPEDENGVTIDPATGDVTLNGDSYGGSGGGGASDGSGSAAPSAIVKYGTKLGTAVFERIDLTGGKYWSGKNVRENIEVNAPEAAAFFIQFFRLQRTSNGATDAHVTLRQIGSSSEFRTDPLADNLTDDDRSTIIWLEIPDDWTDFRVAAHILHLLSTAGPVSTLFGKWLLTTPDAKNQDKAFVLQQWKIDRAEELLEKAGSKAVAFYDALIQSVGLVPGGSAALVAYDISEGKYGAAALEVVFMGPVVDAAGKAGTTVALYVGDKVVAHIPYELVLRFRKELSPRLQKEFLAEIRKATNVDEAIDTAERFLRNRGIVFHGATALDAKAVAKAVEELDVFRIVNDLDLTELAKAQNSTQLGDIGEGIFKDILQEAGYTDIFTVKNASNNGIDIVARLEGGQFAVFEVKTTAVGRPGQFSARQKNLDFFLTDVLKDAARLEKPYRKIDPETAKRANELLSTYQESPTNVTGNLIKIDLLNREIDVRQWQ
jgi:hypothetical protein